MSGNESIAAAHYDQVTTWPRDGLQADIVHIGFGAFHRGHQAVYTDLTNQLSDTRWGSLRSTCLVMLNCSKT